MGSPVALQPPQRSVLPLLALLVLWEAVVRAFDVSPRVFPAIAPVFTAGVDAIQDGTLIRHIGASLGRIALGTLDRHRVRRAARHRDGHQPRGVDLLHAAAALLLGAGRHRVDPDRDAVVRLRLRRHHVRDLQCGVLRRRLQHAAGRHRHCDAAASRGGVARCHALATAHRGVAARCAAQHRDRHPHRAWLRVARPDRRRDDRDQRRAWATCCSSRATSTAPR